MFSSSCSKSAFSHAYVLFVTCTFEIIYAVTCIKFWYSGFTVFCENSLYPYTFVLKSYIKIGYERFYFLVKVSKVVLNFTVSVVYTACDDDLRLLWLFGRYKVVSKNFADAGNYTRFFTEQIKEQIIRNF